MGCTENTGTRNIAIQNDSPMVPLGKRGTNMSADGYDGWGYDGIACIMEGIRDRATVAERGYVGKDLLLDE